MRKVGIFKIEKQALQFWSYLKEKGVDSSLEKDEDQVGWSIWVADEDQVESAQSDIKLFIDDPTDKKFTLQNKLEKPVVEPDQKNFRKPSGFKQFDLRKQWQSDVRKPGVYTLSLIIIVVMVYLVSGMGKNALIINPLKLDLHILEGQIWRLITPIFLHFSFFHIFFNMWWLYDLGSQLEKKKGHKFLLTFIFILAVCSNLSQFLYSGPNFGGMSGVIYGLFGYVWIKTKLDPADGFRLDPAVAMIMFGFFFLCFTGVFGNIANLAHAGGLLVGIGWGFASAYKWNRG